MRSLLSIALATLLAACSENFPLDRLPDQLILYERSALSPFALPLRAIDERDVVYRSLIELMRTERDGWRKSFVSYAPGSFSIESPDHTLRINCWPNKLIVIYSVPGRSGQIEKTIPAVLERLQLKSAVD